MAAVAEINIEIALEQGAPDDRHGISVDAEKLVDECFYVKSRDTESALSAIEDALEDALRKIRAKLDEVWNAG